MPSPSVHDLWRRVGLGPATLERLAAADCFRSIGLDRRQALWEVKALGSADQLPLFDWARTSEIGPEPEVTLPRMALSEHVVNDYQTLRLSLKAHPMSFLRAQLSGERVAACGALRGLKDGAWVAVAGLVLVRQRPGSAKGVVFMTIEDETGVANAVVWPNMLERYRKVVMQARLILIRGRIQRHEDIIHVVSARLEDLSGRLAELTEDGRRHHADPDRQRRRGAAARSGLGPPPASQPRSQAIRALCASSRNRAISIEPPVGYKR